MADSSDVEAALVALVATVNTGARVYRGFPVAPLLDADLAAGIAHVTVAAAGEGRNTSRYISPPVVLGPRVVTLTVAVVPGAASFGGVAGAGQVAGVIVNGVAYAVRLAAAGTPAGVAAALAAIVPGAAASGAVLTAAGLQGARVGADRVQRQEVRRETRPFRVAFWCPTPDARDRAVAAVDPVIAGAIFLPLADGTCGRLRSSGEAVSDRAEDGSLWRRDLLCEVEYATTLAQALPEMLWGTTIAAIGGPGGGGEVVQLGDQVVPALALTDAAGEPLTDAGGHVLGLMEES